MGNQSKNPLAEWFAAQDPCPLKPDLPLHPSCAAKCGAAADPAPESPPAPPYPCCISPPASSSGADKPEVRPISGNENAKSDAVVKKKMSSSGSATNSVEREEVIRLCHLRSRSRRRA